jgi:RNA polymerase sigma-70 factor (ECF subfamily)
MTDWPQVVQQHGPIVWKTVYRLLSNEADASDCFQNTFVSALELSRAEAVRKWPGLLKRLATARALDRLRQRYREATRLMRLRDDFHRPGTEAEPSRLAETAELTEHLRDALAEIDAQQAEVFCLACLEGLDYRQIAKHMGITVNHVGVLLHRAKSSLRERLRAHGPAPAGEPSPQETQP